MPGNNKNQENRREAFLREVRIRMPEVVNSDGSARIPQFGSPWREVFWVSSALYTGSEQDIELANKMIGRYFNNGMNCSNEVKELSDGKVYNIFLSTKCAEILTEFGDLLTPEAREVVMWHTEQVFKTYAGAGQPDVKFHGCNDNMPMMAAKGLILGGQSLHHERAYNQGIWNLHEFRRLLSRSAWASEFNSSTYSPITIANLAKIAKLAVDEDIKKLARECEERMWAEVLLHFHPGTKRSGGPNCRSYVVDLAGHLHSLQVLLWLMFGEDLSGCDILKDYFAPDPMQIVHFRGNIMQNVAEMSDIINVEYHIPGYLAELMGKRTYPALTRGRSESMVRYNGMAGEYHTQSYMEEDFSLGSVDTPLCNGNQTTQFYATYKLRRRVRDFRDSASVFSRCLAGNIDLGQLEKSYDGNSMSEVDIPSYGWYYTMQKNNTVLMLSIVDLEQAPLTTDRIGLDVIFPAHYGKINRSLIGTQPIMDGALGQAVEVVPVSIEAGEVFIHIQPLLPTVYQRRNAVEFITNDRYERLSLVNYDGPMRTFSEAELSLMQNGFVFTIDAKSKWSSLEMFHQFHSDALITDYTMNNHRFFRYIRRNLSFEVCYTPAIFGVQTHAVNGRNIDCPVFESNQLDIAHLPFIAGEAKENQSLFPWGDSLKMHNYPELDWLIGSRGIKNEAPYSRRKSSFILK